ncbi:MAG: MBL fold metallo-hydrolase [Synechococcales bacterium]|nr:MBL fold metallo-hydrolase [Synechococcales bacterium]
MKQLRRWAIGLILTIATVAGIVGLQAPTPAQTQAELTLETAGLTLEELADGVYGLISSTDFPPADPATTAICNGGIVISSDGVLVVDPFQNEALANLLFETVASLTEQPIRYVVNTHYHFDHSGGNAAAAERGFPLVGRGPIREYMLTRNLEMDPNATPPSVVINGMGEIWLGDRQIQLTEFEGHSGGTDLVVYVPDVDVLMAGDLLFTNRLPYLADGNLRLWQANLDSLATTYPTATILPGHGPVSDRTNLLALKGYLEYLETTALDWKAAGLSQEEAVSQTTIPEEYASYLFQGMFPGNLEAAYQQITLGNDDAASIQRYFQAQAPALQAL